MDIEPIGHINTDFPEKFGIPRQSGLVKGLCGRIIFLPQYRNPDYLRGIEEYSHLWILWEFSKSHREASCATVAPPRLGGRRRMGVFATRSPYRPNPIGLSCVKLDSVDYDEKSGTVLTVSGVDMLCGTPVYDIKPYLPYADCVTGACGGFGERVCAHNLHVVFPKELLCKIEPAKQQNIIQILEQDPRTAFIHDEKRVWGVAYSHYNVRFTVCGGTLTVCEVSEKR